MPSTETFTKLICLFHTNEQAQNALSDLQNSGLPPNAVTVIDGRTGSSGPAAQSLSALQQLNLPEKDMRLLSDGVGRGGTIIMVSAAAQFADKVEDIFERHQAAQVDEKTLGVAAPVAAASKAAAATKSAGDAVIPIVEEELVVGKRQVQSGGVRVFSRVVETPVEDSVVLREEHAKVNRVPVDRAVTEADLDALKIQSIEVTEMAEVPVVQKSARVVEEVLVSKDSTERTQRVTDSVRKTEVEVEQIATEPKGSRKR